MKNPFLRVLRANFEGLYRHTVERGEATTVLVPCAECLDSENFSQVFMETHVLQATQLPGCFMNLLGQGVEIQNASTVATDLGFTEHRTCEILQSESMYDFSNTFRVLVIDKPLVGRYRNRSNVSDRGGEKRSGGGPAGVSSSLTWLNQAPAIEDSFYDQLLHFRKTFVQVPGCEQSTAERIREIVGDTTKKLIKHHGLGQPTQQRQLDYQVSRNAYALLHSFAFPHLQNILGSAEKRLEKAIRHFDSAEDLLKAVPGAAGRGLGHVDVSSCSEHLATMDREITPHEKIACINEAHSALQRCVAEGARATSGAGPRSQDTVKEITGDDVLSLFILALWGSALKDRLAHIAYVEMYLQGAAGRSGSNESARFEEAGYAVSALQAALQFFLEDGHRNVGAGATSRGGPRTIGASQFQTQKGGLASGGVGLGLGAAAFGDADFDPPDRVNAHLQGLVQQARASQQAQHVGGMGGLRR